MSDEEIVAYQANRRKFAETEIGKLHSKYHQALCAYWQQDGNENCSYKRLKDLDEAARKTEDEFVARLMADYGVI